MPTQDSAGHRARSGRRRAPARRTGAATWAGVWAAVLAWTALWGWRQAQPSGISWHFFVEGAVKLFGADGLHLYAHNPQLQIGPLAFVLTRPLLLLPAPWDRAAAETLMAATGPVVLAVLAPLVTGGRRRARILAAAAVLIPPWTALAVRWAHLDDVLALVLAVLAVRAVAARRPLAAGWALGGALAAKPWAVGFAPLLLPADGAVGLGEATLAAAGTALTAAILAWGPFLAADSGTLAALRPSVLVADSSGLRTLGYSGELVPAWGRTAQLVLAPALALVAVLRRRWPGVLLVAVAVRLALDPQDIAYYAGGAVLAALVFDLLATRSVVPWTAAVTAVVFWQPFVVDYPHRFEVATGPALWWFRHPGAVGWIHLGWAVAVLVLVLAGPGGRHRPSRRNGPGTGGAGPDAAAPPHESSSRSSRREAPTAPSSPSTAR